MVSSINNLNPYSYQITSGGASGKLYVPVNPAAVIYAQFNHISGIAAKQGQQGVSISKINILNSLIENLSRIKAQKMPNDTSALSDSQVDVLIKNYQKQIQQSVQAAQTTPYMLAGAMPETGSLFTLLA
jgi:hypothetical protein